VLDLAAGTGKPTRKLVERFSRVIAVEPDDAMRDALEAIVPAADVRFGTAQAIPLADDEVAAVFIGEAFHWFAGAKELGEIARVLSPAGGLVLMWYRPVEILLPHGFGSDERTDRERASSGAWRDAFVAAPFEPLREARFDFAQEVDRDTVLAYFASISPIASLPEDERHARLQFIGEQLDRDLYERNLTVDVHWTRLRA
jgi:SAM-dependent methyltransferase